jgi:hypothetical protein
MVEGLLRPGFASSPGDAVIPWIISSLIPWSCCHFPDHPLVDPLSFPGSSPDHAVILLAQSLCPSLSFCVTLCLSAGSRSTRETCQEALCPVRVLSFAEWRLLRPRTEPWLLWRSLSSSWTFLRLSESIGLVAQTPVARYVCTSA